MGFIQSDILCLQKLEEFDHAVTSGELIFYWDKHCYGFSLIFDTLSNSVFCLSFRRPGVEIDGEGA